MKRLLLCAALWACSPKLPYPECKIDADCADHGQVCAGGFCKQCRDDSNCPARAPACVDALCVERPAPPVAPAPAPSAAAPSGCSADSDCAQGRACVERACKPQILDVEPDPLSCPLKAVYFGFDDATLTPEARDTLGADWQCLQQSRYRRVRLTGHTDEHGTTEYNLALAERRADAVKKYLAGLGAEARRLKAISYGKERPRDLGHDDAAWARNRRVDLFPEQ